MTAAQVARKGARLAAYRARAPERLALAEAKRKARAAKKLKPTKAKRTSALPGRKWLSRKLRRKLALESRRRNRQ